MKRQCNNYCVIRTLPGATFIEEIGTKKACMKYANEKPKRFLRVCKMVPIAKWNKDGVKENTTKRRREDMENKKALEKPIRNCDNPLAKDLLGAVILYCTQNPGMPSMAEWNATQYMGFCKWLFMKDGR